MSDAIRTITMPKWGLAMTEGMVTEWQVEEGATLATGDEIMEIETAKITNVFESPVAGTLRRQVVAAGETVPVGALLGVAAEADVPDAAIDAFIADFLANFDATAAEAQAAGPVYETVEAAGRSIRYSLLGDGAAVPLILIHGFGGDLNSWMFNHLTLAEDRPVYAIDLPGHGGSAKDVGAGDVAAMVAVVADFMAALGIERAHFAGHSLGGATALKLAVDAPARVASATLICPAGLGPDINIDYIDGFIAAGRPKALKPVLEMLFADPSLVSRDMINEVLKYKRLDGVDAALRAIAAAAFAGNRQAEVLRDSLAALGVPVQVIWGRADRIVPAAHAEGLPDGIAVHLLDDAGHMAHMERAGDVNTLMAAFLKE